MSKLSILFKNTEKPRTHSQSSSRSNFEAKGLDQNLATCYKGIHEQGIQKHPVLGHKQNGQNPKLEQALSCVDRLNTEEGSEIFSKNPFVSTGASKFDIQGSIRLHIKAKKLRFKTCRKQVAPMYCFWLMKNNP